VKSIRSISLLALIVITMMAVACAQAQDTTVDATGATRITLNGDSIVVEGSGAVANGSTLTITSAGTYSLTGSLTDGQIVVDSSDQEWVTLILSGVNIHNEDNAAIFVMNAEGTNIVVAEGTQNVVSDGGAYDFGGTGLDEPNAAIFSDDDLTITGSGSLTVDARYNDAIASKDGLVISESTIVITSVDDGIRGKDYLLVTGANLNVTTQGDGLKSDNDEDSTLGTISLSGSMIAINSGGDAITAETTVTITDGTFNLVSGGGSSYFASEDVSTKGIKAGVSVRIDGGTFTINASDDALHSNGSIVINGGAFALATGDDGIHADATVDINGGAIDISTSYEGIESAIITINAGDIHLIASDDGLNAAGGNDGSGFGGGLGGRPGRDNFAASGNYHIYINGGYISIDANGDGVDANGSIDMTGGVVIVNGPTQSMNSALDYDGTFAMSGGFFVATGSAGMAQSPDQSSSQNSLLLNLNGTQPAGTLIHIQSSDGSDILTFAPSKEYQSLTFSSPDLALGSTYSVYIGGTSDGAQTDGLYTSGVYTPGTYYTDFSVSSVVTMLGNAGFGMGGGRPGRP